MTRGRGLTVRDSPAQYAHERRLQPEEGNERKESGLYSETRRYRERHGRDHELGDGWRRPVWPHGDEHEGGGHDHGGEQAPARFEHLRPVGIPHNRQVDGAEASPNPARFARTTPHCAAMGDTRSLHDRAPPNPPLRLRLAERDLVAGAVV